jgi:hypothetical protein
MHLTKAEVQRAAQIIFTKPWSAARSRALGLVSTADTSRKRRRGDDPGGGHWRSRLHGILHTGGNRPVAAWTLRASPPALQQSGLFDRGCDHRSQPPNRGRLRQLFSGRANARCAHPNRSRRGRIGATTDLAWHDWNPVAKYVAWVGIHRTRATGCDSRQRQYARVCGRHAGDERR